MSSGVRLGVCAALVVVLVFEPSGLTIVCVVLETTDEPIDRVAELAGFGSPAALRQHFNRMVRTSPTAYRRAFRQEEPVA